MCPCRQPTRCVQLSLTVISFRYEREVVMAGARGSQTEMAVLGALSIEPMTGYALRETIRDVLGHFWSESFGQIYPALAELERHDHVTRSGSTRAGSSRFAITPSGTQRLRDLLSQPVQAAPPRNGLLL